jgi:alpha-amylase
MASVCIYFQVHQPFRLRRYSAFDAQPNYFDDYHNERILEKVAKHCYLPATELLLQLIERHEGRFRLAFSLTGLVIEQFEQWCPPLIDRFKALADTGCVEFLGETYHHSLAFLYSREEFDAQVRMHSEAMQRLFGQTPRVFRHTELIYNNELSRHMAAMGGYVGLLSEGADQILGQRRPNLVYRAAGGETGGDAGGGGGGDAGGGMKLLLKNYTLSDDIAFRFSNRSWPGYPLTAAKFAEAVMAATRNGTADDEPAGGGVCNLFMDFETFGEHQWAETGIFQFLEQMPDAILARKDMAFVTPGECIDRHAAADEFDVPHMISWADTERDLSAWLGNAMQSNALHELYQLEEPVKSSGDPRLLADWRRLSSSDHFYYMCTKYMADGDVHKYFNPYESPYDSYINFMNVLDNLRTRVGDAR